MKLPYRLLIFVCVALVGIGGGYMIAEMRVQEGSCKGYSFINTSIPCGSAPVISKAEYHAVRAELVDFIESERQAGRLTEAAIYFRDLHNGPIFGINEFTEFAPASLLKLPLAVVYMDSADDNPDLLTGKMEYSGTTTLTDQNFMPSLSAEAGKTYTVKELLKLMTTNSDNASYEILETYLAESPERAQIRLRVFQELGLIDPQNRTADSITVRGYASLLRILYNHSYLSVGSSEQILAWLADADFDDGLVAGVPSGTKVAHKFGERGHSDGTKQLQDCGIIYYPENPYLLCVMVRGQEWQPLMETIQHVSRTVYEEVDSRRY